MVKIECLECDKTLKLPQYIDTDNYDGQLVCSKCKAILHVKLVKGKVRKYKVERIRQAKPEMKIYVQNEKTKQLLQRIGERTGKMAADEGIQEEKNT